MTNSDLFKGSTRMCGKCKKEFIKPVSNLYKLVINNKTVHYCSYTCYQSAKNEYKGGR